jgi:hypothetical protein
MLRQLAGSKIGFEHPKLQKPERFFGLWHVTRSPEKFFGLPHGKPESNTCATYRGSPPTND